MHPTTRRRILFAALVIANIIAFGLAWEQPDCAASMECRGTVTIPEALSETFMSVSTVGRNMQVVIGFDNADDQPLNHVSDVEHTDEGVDVHFEGPDGGNYGTTRFYTDGAYIKSVTEEDA